MSDDRTGNPKHHPHSRLRGLEGLDAHLLRDLWGVTPDQLAVARGLPTHCDGVGALLRMGHQKRARVKSDTGRDVDAARVPNSPA
ncbi:hypothetical protein [Rhodospirillum sp. A1_3_36]|uniref:hypothetical protein n=1 Tax=Rhodospirillum sp. A1_3_36 TaxID=3391666 RepID=UPI0039A7507D